ncbi:unnamed protein product [Staurois parvus]|uniref:Uncharacterized protein n=1 Tax=Staurois parvus TaxID=386267 RepID=A0ABN9GWK6_9NEOB|nr:unnamed protein product [Staurois parvus]
MASRPLLESAQHRDPVPTVSSDRCTGPLCEVPIIDRPISDHMQSSTQ